MRLLLDTHVAIWALIEDKRLGDRARELIANPDNAVYVSAASVWEIAIKHSLGRKAVPFSGSDALRYFSEAGFEGLDVSAQHAAASGELPPHHTDPFDRLLVAQALTEPLRLITHDKTLAPYSDSIILI